MKNIISTLLFLILISSLNAQNTDYAVELAAFDQSVPLSYFKKINGVYETYDVNQIYRYHIAAKSKEEAEVILASVKKQGFPNARIIDFAYIREVCKAQCGYIPPKPTGIGAAPKKNNNKPPVSLNATALLGENAETIPKELENPEWLAFYEKYKDLGFSEAFLYEIYSTFGGSIKIDKAAWFEFKKKNAHLGVSDAELFEFFIKHGDLKISEVDWFMFKTKSDEEFKDWLAFKEKNRGLDATNEELLVLYDEYGNIVISQAMWFIFQEEQDSLKATGQDPISSKVENWSAAGADVQSISFILFEFGGTQPWGDAFKEMDKLANSLKKNNKLKVELTGHTDAIGSASQNKVLSLNRAKRVQQYLLQKGVPPDQITVKGMGEDTPIAINNNPDGSDSPLGRRYNRRVELKVTDPDGNIVQIVSVVEVPENLRRR